MNVCVYVCVCTRMLNYSSSLRVVETLILMAVRAVATQDTYHSLSLSLSVCVCVCVCVVLCVMCYVLYVTRSSCKKRNTERIDLQLELGSDQASQLRRDINFICALHGVMGERHVGIECRNRTCSVRACR